MNHRKYSIIFLGALILGIIVGVLLFDPSWAGLCRPNIHGYCRTALSRTVGEPLVNGFFVLLPIPVILFFLRPEVFKTWAKFAAVALPLGIILIAITSPQGSGSFATPDIDREIITWFVSILFLVISLILILVKSLTLRKQP